MSSEISFAIDREELAERGGVHILDRWFPKKHEQQLSLPLDPPTSNER